MMAQHVVVLIFKYSWGFLLGVALLAQFILGGKVKKKAGFVTNFIVALPYLIMFGWFSVRDTMGTYRSVLVLQWLGLGLMALGASGYVVSIFFLRKQWAVAAAIKEGHQLITAGPYRYVRHPMYSFVMLAIAGSGLLLSNYMILFYMPVIAAIYVYRARQEEELLRKEFPVYEQYVQKTRMLIPGIF